MHNRKKHHSIGTAERIESPIIANRIHFRILDAAFLKQFPLCRFLRCFSGLNMTALGLLCLPLLVSRKDHL